MVECVPNLSEGRDAGRIRRLVEAVSESRDVYLLDTSSDADHHRTVITFAGPQHAVAKAAFQLAARALKEIDLRGHAGVHPRLGALDVLPFVPLGETTLEECAALAHRVGERIAQELGIPVYFYEAAARLERRRKLEDVRRGGFEGIGEALKAGDETKAPDLGGPLLHPTAGAVIVGARRFLIAFNVLLNTADVAIAREIARAIRASNGGLPSVKALGLALPSRGLVQISLNLTDFERTPPLRVVGEIRRLAATYGLDIVESELIGLMPSRAVELTAAAALALPRLERHQVIEHRLDDLMNNR